MSDERKCRTEQFMQTDKKWKGIKGKVKGNKMKLTDREIFHPNE